MSSVELYSPKYFMLCGIGGIFSCGLTHWSTTPVDVVKCNAQFFPNVYNKGMIGNSKLIYNERGIRGLGRGWSPTMIGYSLQGLGKFGLYEIFKHRYGELIGEYNAKKYRRTLYCVASASAEFFADILLCPWESTKLKVQKMHIDQVKYPDFAVGISDGLPKLYQFEGTHGLFQILPTLWARQIPYTVIKFVAFEQIIEWIYGYTQEHWGRNKKSFSKLQQLGFSFIAGYSAGVICGAVSHPFDTMASKLSQYPDKSLNLKQRCSRIYYGYNEIEGIGFRGLWKGFGPRVFMIGTLTALQWFIYDSFKKYNGFETTGAEGKVVLNEEENNT